MISAVLLTLYASALIAGLVTLENPDAPIADPWFTAMEVLILLLMPALIAVTAALHTLTERGRRYWGLLAVTFTTATAIVTSCVHFAILTLSRRPPFAEWTSVFTFEWPSVVYVLDILAWDVFFAAAAVSAALALPPDRSTRAARWLLLIAGVLSFAGLSGVALDDMRFRNIGAVGYVGFLLPALLALTWVFPRLCR